MTFRHCGIIGLGLLGGSLAFDLRQHFPEMRITGIARREATLAEAEQLYSESRPLFDVLTQDLSAVRDADLVILCTPVQTIIQHLADLAPQLSPGTVVTDVGSTKRAVMNAAATMLPRTVQFVGGHPMAGSDRAGLAYARGGLYRGATWAFCVPEGAEESVARLIALVSALGACPVVIEADTHDRLVALTSHLPHVVAGSLANCVLGSSHGDAVLPFIAGGFRDSTRIAAANPAMWRDILLTNRDCVLEALDLLMSDMQQWRDAIAARDLPHLEALLTTACQRRETLNRTD